jgi:anti-anti-sigma factor
VGPPAFEIRRSDEHLALVGELDANSSPELEAALRAEDDSPVTVDLRRLDFIDSSGIRTLLSVRRAHPTIRLINVTKQHIELFGILGITDLLLGGPTT